MAYSLFLKKRQNLKLSSAANYRWTEVQQNLENSPKNTNVQIRAYCINMYGKIHQNEKGLRCPNIYERRSDKRVLRAF